MSDIVDANVNPAPEDLAQDGVPDDNQVAAGPARPARGLAQNDNPEQQQNPAQNEVPDEDQAKDLVENLDGTGDRAPDPVQNPAPIRREVTDDTLWAAMRQEQAIHGVNVGIDRMRREIMSKHPEWASISKRRVRDIRTARSAPGEIPQETWREWFTDLYQSTFRGPLRPDDEEEGSPAMEYLQQVRRNVRQFIHDAMHPEDGNPEARRWVLFGLLGIAWLWGGYMHQIARYNAALKYEELMKMEAAKRSMAAEEAQSKAAAETGKSVVSQVFQAAGTSALNATVEALNATLGSSPAAGHGDEL